MLSAVAKGSTVSQRVGTGDQKWLVFGFSSYLTATQWQFVSFVFPLVFVQF